MNALSEPAPLQTLQQHVILITGAAGCLGGVAARACASQGATVILLDKTIPGLERIYDAIVAAGAPEPAIYPLDLSGANERHYRELASVIEQQFGVLHGLLHNAALFGALSPVVHCSGADWSRIIDTNLNAPFLLTRALLPVMEQAEDASIVFTSDSAARAGRAYWSAYGVSKIAVEGLARILADELDAKGKVRVNTLVPGIVDSPIRSLAFPGENPARRRTAASLEALYLFLLGPESRGRTGEVFEAEQLER
jgi:NAD(P)-dependent dehydrogenase (short-subunit alcohol dehydrogenase family)